MTSKKRYWFWSAKTAGFLFVIVSLITLFIVFIVSEKSIFTRIEITISIMAAILFAFLVFGLYYGIRMKKEQMEVPIPKLGPDTFNPDLALDGCSEGIFLADDFAGFFGTLLLGIILALVISLLFPAIWGGFLMLFAGLFWVFSRALRIVFTKSRICKGNLSLSLRYGLKYTFIYTGWIFIVIFIINLIRK